MKKILVNASAAKKGGALSIIESFSEAKYLNADADVFYYILSPKKPDYLPEMSKWIKVSTSGLGTTFFALFFSWFVYKYFGCDKLVSFSNINTVFPANKVTYFHQFLTLTKNTYKHKIIRLLIRYTQLKNNLFIFQTPYVRNVFLKTFGSNYSSKVCWPGLTMPARFSQNLTVKNELDKKRTGDKVILVCPIPDISIPHKNFSYLKEISSVLSTHNVELLVTCSPSNAIAAENITPIGQLSRDEYLHLITVTDGIIIVSKEETVSLPIFEAIQLNKPAFVLTMPYIEGLYELFGEVHNLFTFSTVDELIESLGNVSKESEKNMSFSFSIGHWEF